MQKNTAQKNSTRELRLRGLVAAALLGTGSLLLSSTTAHAQSCMGDEGFEINPVTGMTYVQGMQNAADLNCTANDVVVAETSLISVNGQPPDPSGNECLEGEVVTVELLADLESNSNARRSDIGIWLAEDGGDAITGQCQQFYFVAPDLEQLDTVPDDCRDIGAQNLFSDVPLDTPQSSLDVVCRDEDGNGLLDVGSCIGWKIPGDDQVCPDDADGNGTSNEPNDFIKGTLPANKAKCRCSNIEIPIVVKKNAHIEVIKELLPANDTGLFTLQIDAGNTAQAVDQTDGGTTDRVMVSAGTSVNPGEDHTVGEIAGTGTELSDYNSSIACVDRGTNTYNGGSPLTQAGPGPLLLMVDPDDDIVCIITNLLRGGSVVLAVEKTGDLLSKVGDTVNYQIQVDIASSAPLTCTVNDSLLGGLGTIDFTPGDAPTILNPTYVVQEGDPNPLPNTVTVNCAFDPATGETIDPVTDDHSVDLFQPSITFDKTGDPLSKIGDDTAYTLTLINTSSANTPDLICTVTDAAIGVNEEVVLSAGAPAHVINASAPIPANAADPYVNTASVSCEVADFSNVLEASDDHSVNLFVPSITFAKTGDPLSKIGDDTAYTLTLTNTSSANTPDLTCTVTDAAIGVNEEAVLASGEQAEINASAPIPGDAVDPYVNTASVSCEVAGFPNVLEASDDHSVDLVQPSITFDKTGDALSKIGDDTAYTLTLTNTSSANTPELTCTVTDAAIGVNEEVVLSAGASAHVINASAPIPANAADPYVNTASVSCEVAGFPNVLEASDDHSVNLFAPSITFDKTGDPLSKIGDDTAYTLTLTNTSSADTPDLTCTVTDAAIGVNEEAVLASGEQAEINASAPIPGDAVDPYVNTASVSCEVAGFPNVLEASDDHSVDLFAPSIMFDKTGDALSKIGDDTAYTLTLTNTSSANTPELTCTVTDAAIGVGQDVVLSAGAPAHVINASAPVPANAADPYLNTASVSCTVAGFSNVLEAGDDHSVNLFQPSITFDKSGDEVSKVGDSAAYVITLDNTSSTDTPDLTCTVTDAVTGVNEMVMLSAGAPAHVINTSVSIPANGADPYLNTASVSCEVAGFSNVLEASDDHSVDLVHPSFDIGKSCTNEPVPQEGPATWDILVSNTGDVALVITVTDVLLPGGSQDVPLAASTSTTLQVSLDGPFAGQETVSNTADASAVIDPSVGTFTNVIQPNSSMAECIVGGQVELLKLTNGIEDPSAMWSFNLYEGPDGFGGPVLAGGSTPPALLDFDDINLDPAMTYTVCESEVPPAWSTLWEIDTDGDGAVDTIIMPYNPNADDDPPASLGNQCFDFGAGTAYPVPQGGTVVFAVDNTMDGGEPRTPGYWKNWNTCTGGGQAGTAANNGGPDEGWFLLDDILNSPGVTWDDVLPDDGILFEILSCEDGVRILDQRDIASGKKRASDAAYTLAMHLLAAQLNFAAGAENCQGAQDAALDAEALLDQIDFVGTDRYLRPRNALYQPALALAALLDDYNNNGQNSDTCNP